VVTVNVPRIRIAWVMVAVAIAALDFGAIRAMSGSDTGMFLLLGDMPMANVLAVGILVGQRRPGSRPFVLGFEILGAIALVVYVNLAIFFSDEALKPYLAPFLGPIEKTIRQSWPLVHDPIVYSLAVVMLAWPQVAVALIGGYLGCRYKVTFTRRW
jgi:hypothetical protein